MRFEFVTAMDMKIPAFFSAVRCVVVCCGTRRPNFKFVRHISKR